MHKSKEKLIELRESAILKQLEMLKPEFIEKVEQDLLDFSNLVASNIIEKLEIEILNNLNSKSVSTLFNFKLELAKRVLYENYGINKDSDFWNKLYNNRDIYAYNLNTKSNEKNNYIPFRLHQVISVLEEKSYNLDIGRNNIIVTINKLPILGLKKINK